MKVKFIVSLSLMTYLLAACGTMELQVNTKNTRTITIDHSQIKNKSIYVQVTNTANGGGERMDLESNIKKALLSKGYTIADSSEASELGLFVNVLFANNLKEAHAIKAAAGLGAYSGVVAMGSGSNTGNSLLIGVSAALAGATIGKALEDETFKAVIDVEVKNYLESSSEKTRVFAQAVKMDLDLNEALPILEKESTRSIANIF